MKFKREYKNSNRIALTSDEIVYLNYRVKVKENKKNVRKKEITDQIISGWIDLEMLKHFLKY